MDDTIDIREALAEALREQGIERPAPVPAVDMSPERARELAWGAYGLTPPGADEMEA